MDTNLTIGRTGRKSNPTPRALRHGPRAESVVRVLGLCGLLSAVFSATAGFFEIPLLLGVAGATMVVGNVFAIVGCRRSRRASR